MTFKPLNKSIILYI